MSVRRCSACQHDTPHNVFGKCKTPGCSCKSYTADLDAPEPTRPPDAVMVIRNQVTETPVAVPDEIVKKAERPYRAYCLHAGGQSWEDIAILEMWDSPDQVRETVKRYLAEGAAVWGEFRRVEAIALEVGRLNMLTKAVWGEALKGNIPAVMAALAVSKQRAAILKFTDREPGDAGEQPLPTTVVVGSDSYIYDLKKIVEGPAPLYGDIIFDDDDPDSEPYLADVGTV